MAIIEINGKKVEAEAGSMIIEVADALGLQIPRFCYHKKLSIAANCRMCLVDIEKSPKALPACATPISDGMKIWTQSPKALAAQRAVMEFLLINHPLDCPICDQGGECELQDVAMGYGKSASRYTEGKRSVKDLDLGPLISSDMTRCIQCTRCVRFGSEVAGIRELGAYGRGEHLEIGTYVEKSIDSEVSGNIIDLCPVGALTSKPYRFQARGWELKQTAAIAPHDGLGSHVFIHARSNQVLRVVPKEQESINEVWLSDRDRFSYEGLSSAERLTQPKIKENHHWRAASWQEALELTAEILTDTSVDQGGTRLGALISPNATVEEFYLLQKLMRGLGSNNIDHRLRQLDFRNQEHASLYPSLGVRIPDLEQQKLTILLGSDLGKEQPLLSLRLRKSVLANGQVFVINPIDFDFNFDVQRKIIVPGGDLVLGLASLLKAVVEQGAVSLPSNIARYLATVPVSEDASFMAQQLRQQEHSLLLLGALALSHPEASQLRILAQFLAKILPIQVGMLSEGANTAGAWLAGAVPHRWPGGKKSDSVGLSAADMLKQPLSSYVLVNLEPDLDSADGAKAMQTLMQAQHVLAITPFESESLRQVAEVLLPMAAFTETAGTFVNMEGCWQAFKPAVLPLGESRPLWKILRVLGQLCTLEGFEFNSTEEIIAACQSEDRVLKESYTDEFQILKSVEAKNKLVRIAPVPLYASDNLVRRAKSLQRTKDAGIIKVYFNAKMQKAFGISGDTVRIQHGANFSLLPWEQDESVPDHSLLLVGAKAETLGLGQPYDHLSIDNP